VPRAFFAEQFKIPTLWAQDPVGSRSLGGLITLTDNDVDDTSHT
jgi:hypothetical protein